MWQKAQGETEIYIGSRKFKNPEEALNYLATRPDVQKSLEDMRTDLRNGKSILTQQQLIYIMI